MKLFIITNVLGRGANSNGMVAIKAESLEQCREFFIDRFGGEYSGNIVEEYDNAILDNDYKVLDLASTDTSAVGIIERVWGDR